MTSPTTTAPAEVLDDRAAYIAEVLDAAPELSPRQATVVATLIAGAGGQ